MPAETWWIIQPDAADPTGLPLRTVVSSDPRILRGTFFIRSIHRLRSAGLISPNDPADFPLGFFFLDDLTFVVFLSATAQAKKDFGYSSLEIDLERDKGQPLL